MQRRLWIAAALSANAKPDPLEELHLAIRAFVTALAVKQDVAAAMRWADASLEENERMRQGTCLLDPPGPIRTQVEQTLRFIASRRYKTWRQALDETVLRSYRDEVGTNGYLWQDRWLRDGYIVFRHTAEAFEAFRNAGPPDANDWRLLERPIDEKEATAILPFRGLALSMVWRLRSEGWRFVAAGLTTC
jgi:hypothetical protein